jgi:hypothetical protein
MEGDCGEGQGLSWAVEPRRESEHLRCDSKLTEENKESLTRESFHGLIIKIILSESRFHKVSFMGSSWNILLWTGLVKPKVQRRQNSDPKGGSPSSVRTSINANVTATSTNKCKYSVSVLGQTAFEKLNVFVLEVWRQSVNKHHFHCYWGCLRMGYWGGYVELRGRKLHEDWEIAQSGAALPVFTYKVNLSLWF